MLAIAAVIVAARAVGALAARIGQPKVMGEVLADILLGPTLLGALAPGVQAYLFPPQVVPLLAAAGCFGKFARPADTPPICAHCLTLCDEILTKALGA
jgi:Kef-type K+ transport system membrane component KefB